MTDFHCALPMCERRREALPEVGSDMCSGCRSVVYCGQACLVAHWDEHKVDC